MKKRFRNRSSEKISESHTEVFEENQQLKMAPTKMTLQTSQLVAVKEDTADWKATIKSFADKATARNMVDLLLVITILVLLGIAAPIIRGDHCGEFVSYRHGSRTLQFHFRLTVLSDRE